MGDKGDHVFNNVGSVVRGYLAEGLRCYGRELGLQSLMNVNEGQMRTWLSDHAPVSSTKVEELFNGEWFGTRGKREGLMTSTWTGDDPNAGQFALFKTELRQAILEFFEQLAVRNAPPGGGGSVNIHHVMIPDIAPISLAFGSMARFSIDDRAWDTVAARGKKEREMLESAEIHLYSGGPFLYDLFETLARELVLVAVGGRG